MTRRHCPPRHSSPPCSRLLRCLPKSDYFIRVVARYRRRPRRRPSAIPYVIAINNCSLPISLTRGLALVRGCFMPMAVIAWTSRGTKMRACEMRKDRARAQKITQLVSNRNSSPRCTPLRASVPGYRMYRNCLRSGTGHVWQPLREQERRRTNRAILCAVDGSL